MDDVTRDSPTQRPGRTSVGGVIAGRYRVCRLLGRGASKEVFLAYDEPLDREIAVAIVFGAADDVTRARVVREAQLIGRLGDHPNIITVHDVGKLDDGTPYLVMRAMTGGSLADLLGRERLDLARTIRIGREIASALAHAHEHDVVHRDVKPDNVWLAADGSAALGDFGIAHRAGSERLTAEGMVVGTVHYLSPEQISGGDVGPASDLYALGATLYELVCGRPPFIAADPNQVLTQHLATTPAPPSQLEPGVPAALDALILELLDKQPERRPPSAASVAQRLAELGGGADSADRGTTLAAPAQPRDFRRLVTVLAAGADIDDPEALHGALERCTTAIERHGGTVERYLGHTLIGFFGLTESHGDDALRAARAAAELRDAMPELRLGIETGELYLGAGSRGPTGAAIMVAGRLAERAAPGEILLGDRVRNAIDAEAGVDPASGKLIELRVEQPALTRPAVTPFVGRASELEELQAQLERVRDERACRLVTIAGEPGIGKSRLAHEFLVSVGDDTTVLVGRCLAYGEGTTYRALAELVRRLGGEPRARVQELLDGDEQAIRGVLAAIGESDEPAHPEESSWALRRLLERVARDGPLVVALEDIHWADSVLLDLIDHLAALSSGSPILLVCLTRPELLERRPAWAAPQPNRSLITLAPLPAADARELAAQLGAGDLAARIAQRAEGNPLFVEQLVAVDEGQDTRELPVTIQGVLEARIDQLDANGRMLLQRAAVEGRTFHADALTAMLPAHAQRGVDAQLVALARKGLIGADTSELAGENAFRFSHALIRDVAYAGLPKLARAEMHTFVAGWLEERPAAADEIVAYHLEQACLLAAELGRAGEREHALALRAGERFQSASQAALFRGDPASAAALLERAVTLVESDAAAAGALQPGLGEALYVAGELTTATRVLDEAIAHAREPRLAARAQVEREFVRLETEASVGTAQTRRVADAVQPLLERAGDDHGLCRLWSLRAQADWTAGQAASADAAWSEAAEHARRAGDERAEFDVLGWRSTAAVFGPTPVSEAIERCERFRERVAASPVAVLWMLNPLASLHAMRGDFELADALLEEATEIRRKLGTLDFTVSHHAAYVWLLAGEPERAERPLRAGMAKLASMGEGRLMATTTAMLAQAVFARGDAEEAADLCRRSATAAAADDIVTHVVWRGVQARILAGAGSFDEARALAGEAVASAAATDLLSHHGDAMFDLADVLQVAGQPLEAAEAARAAKALYDAKGNAVRAAQCGLQSARHDELRGAHDR